MNIFKKIYRKWKRRRLEKRIAKQLDTPEGRAALGEAMIEPIKRALERRSVFSRAMNLLNEVESIASNVVNCTTDPRASQDCHEIVQLIEDFKQNRI